MPILQCEYGGVTVEFDVKHAEIQRAKNAMQLEEIKIAEWDAMPKRARRKMLQDYEWLMKRITKHKVKGRRLIVGSLMQRLGDMEGNK